MRRRAAGRRRPTRNNFGQNAYQYPRRSERASERAAPLSPCTLLRGKAFLKTRRGTVCGRGLLAGIRGRPTSTTRRTRMATGVGSLQYPYHITRTYCSLARAPHTHPLVFVTAVSHMRAGPVVRATSWSSKLSTQRSHRHRFCIAIVRFSIQAGPPVSATRPSLVLFFSRALCARMCAIAIALACPHPPRTHAPRPHTQTGPPVSATRPSLVLFFSRALCARMCVIAMALARHRPTARSLRAPHLLANLLAHNLPLPRAAH